MRNVLLIAYDFPPMSVSRALRTLKFVKYLPIFGWNPIILTVEKDINNLEFTNASFSKELSAKVNIYRSQIMEPYDIYRLFGGKQKQFSRECSILHTDCKSTKFSEKIKNIVSSFFIPDAKIGWYPGAIRKAKQIFNKHKIDVIYSTSPKNTAHIIAKYLSRRYKKPWVADFRDPWPAYYQARPSLLKKLDESWEDKVLSEATRITVAWPGILKDITVRHKDFDKSKAILFTNGFDEDDFNGVIPKELKHFTISYAGTFYKDRNPESLFKGLALLFKEKSELRKDIRVLFIGISDPLLRNLIDKYNLSDVVEHIPHITHRECISYLAGSHLLFLDTLRDCVPGKLYEYLGLRKPILALVPFETTVAKIINETQAGVVVDPKEIEKIKDTIMALYVTYKQCGLRLERKDDSVLHQYERKRSTGRLAEVFNEICY